MNPAVITIAYVLMIVTMTIIFDAGVYARGGWESTISYLCLTRGKNYPVLIVATGLLVGHLFIPAPDPDTVAGKATAWISSQPLILLGIGLALSRFWAQPNPTKDKDKPDKDWPPLG